MSSVSANASDAAAARVLRPSRIETHEPRGAGAGPYSIFGWQPATPSPHVALIASSLSLGAAAIHFGITAEHAAMSPIHGLGFTAVAWFQALWAVAFAIRPTAVLSLAGIAANLAVIGVWLLSRTAGLPVGLGGALPERAGVVDVIATAGEAALVALLVLPPAAQRRLTLHWGTARRTAAVAAAVAATVALVLVAPPEATGRHSLGGDPDGHDHGHGIAPAATAPAATAPSSAVPSGPVPSGPVPSAALPSAAVPSASAESGDDQHQEHAVEPADQAPGQVTFGRGLNTASLEIAEKVSTFKVGEFAAWRADLARPMARIPIVMTISKESSSGERAVVWTMDAPIQQEGLEHVAAEADLSSYVDGEPGTYVLRFLEGDTVLAEGAFTITR